MPSLALSPPECPLVNGRKRTASAVGVSSATAAGMRSVVHAIVLTAIGALVVNTWLVSGLLVPAIVTGSSMAPSLMGPHYRWQCAGCQRAIHCDRDALPAAGGDVVCPRCGARNDTALGTPAAGQRLFVDRAAFGWRAPRRWEPVALRSPENGTLCVKRIAGLPGENVELRAGDLVIDGQRPRKPLTVQLAMAVTVADEGDLARWRSLREGAWKLAGDRWQHRAGPAERIDWLEYRHQEPTTPEGDGDGESPILDGSPVNQSESRRLNEVSDFVLRCTLHGAAQDRCFITIHTRGDEFRVLLPVGGGGARLSHNGNRVTGGRVASGQHAALAVEIVVADGRFTLRAAGKSILEHAFEPLPHVEGAPLKLAIGADEAALAVSGLKILRDAHFTPGPQGQTRYRLRANEYFVLGDNSANSVDSRAWVAVGGVNGTSLLGPVLVW